MKNVTRIESGGAVGMVHGDKAPNSEDLKHMASLAKAVGDRMGSVLPTPFSNKPVRGILVELPIATKSPNRQKGFTKGAAMARHAEVARTRDFARAQTLRMLGLARLQPSDLLPATITFTRISAGELDDDNIRGAFKSTRDGVCKALGIDDSRKAPATFLYEQRRGPRGKPKVEVLIARREP